MRGVLGSPGEYLKGGVDGVATLNCTTLFFWCLIDDIYDKLNTKRSWDYETSTEVNKIGSSNLQEKNKLLTKLCIFGGEQKLVFLKGKVSYDRSTMVYNHLLIGSVDCKISFRIDTQSHNIQGWVIKTMLSKFMVNWDDQNSLMNQKFSEL